MINTSSTNIMKTDALHPLLAWSGDTNFSACSSYAALANYLPHAEKVTSLRQWPRRLDQRVLNRVVRNYAISDWYQLSSLAVEKQVWQKIQKANISLVHFLWAERDLGYMEWLYKKHHPPICCTFHICSDTLPKVIRKRKFIQKLSAVIIMSESQRPFFESCGLVSSKIHFIPHGVDTDFFRPLSGKKDNNNKFIVLCVGNYRRNFSMMREVCQKLEHNPHIAFKIISSELNSKYFSDLKNVDFLSGLNADELLHAYQTSSCLLLAIENATANNALLEAMACGLPIISENVGGIAEYVNDICSDLSPHGDVDSIIKSILTLSKNPERQRIMSDNARNQSLFFSWDKISKATQEIYKNLPINH